MSLKEDFLGLIDEVPEGISDKNYPIPTLPVIGWPEDEEAAIIAQGQLASNINVILKTFEGLTPVELLLRVGQRSNVMKGLLLACLEYLGSSEFEFEVTAPIDGHVYAEDEQITFLVLITNGEFSSGLVTYDSEELTLKFVPGSEGFYKVVVSSLPVGSYHAVFKITAIVDNEEYIGYREVSFSVE